MRVVKNKSMSIITDTPKLKELCESLAKEPFIAIDTEFLRDRTYYAKLCLIQVSSDTVEPHAIDPLADGIDLAPLYELLANENVIKVFHAARQDLEIFYNLTGTIPTPLFDTQVAGMVCGYGDTIGYLNLVQSICDVRLDKGPQFTNWAHRPLSKKQISYALDDVHYLRDIYKSLRRQLKETGREKWVDEEMATLTSTDTYESPPELAWERIKIKTNKAQCLAVLRAVAAIREEEAQNRDIPKAHILKDHSLVDIAIQMPTTPEDMQKIRSLSADYAKSKIGKRILQAVIDAKELPKEEWPKIEKRKMFPSELGPVLEMLKMLLRIQSSEHNVAARLIADSKDLEDLCLDDNADILALKGWRREVFGEEAIAMKHGRVTLGLTNNEIVKKIID